MKNKQKQITNITKATALAAAEREKRMANALRENLKRRKTTVRITKS
jgi:hypothetical protein